MTIDVLITGRNAEPLFMDVLRVLHEAEASVAARSLDAIEFAPRADLLIVLQLWPDEYTRADVIRLIDAAPLSRLVVCYGPWCDSAGRTRDVWPHGCRVPVALAAARLRRELDELRAGVPPLPRTASRNDAFASAERCPSTTCDTSLVIGVSSLDPALSDTIPDVLNTRGHSVVYERLAEADVVVWDADPWGGAARDELAALKRSLPETPIVALCGFPRLHEIQEMQNVGIASVILKSAENDLLVEQLERIAAIKYSPKRPALDRVTHFRSRPTDSRLSCPE